MQSIISVISLIFLSTAVHAQTNDTKLSSAKEKGHPELILDTGGHTLKVTKILFTPNGKEVISVSMDATIRIWDVETWESRVLRLSPGTGKEGGLKAAALSPDGKTLAVAGDGYILDGKKDVPIYLFTEVLQIVDWP